MAERQATASNELNEALALVTKATGVNLGQYLPQALQAGLQTRKAAAELPPGTRYLDRLRTDPNECQALLDAMAINVTSFFRDPLTYELIAEVVLPDLISRSERAGSSELRMWSAGCATGEEPCSLVMLAREALWKCNRRDWSCLVFGTDIDEHALTVARAGQYCRSQLANVRLGLLDRYFTDLGDQFKVCDDVRGAVQFARDDLTQTRRLAPAASVFGTFDLVLCRNVLLYFSPELRRSVLARLSKTIRQGGYLVLGDTEFLDPATATHFKVVHPSARIFKKR